MVDKRIDTRIIKFGNLCSLCVSVAPPKPGIKLSFNARVAPCIRATQAISCCLVFAP